METIKNERLLSLDILRGLTIILMIIVNTPGSWDHVYAPFLHAEWNGVTPTGFIRIQTGVLGCFVPNCSRVERLSILIWTPMAATLSISSKETPLGVNIICSGLKPAFMPN